MKLLSCALLACATAVQAYQLTRTAPRTVPRVASIRAEAAAPTADDKLVAFNKFLEKKGIVSDKVQAATLPGWGVCLVAGPDGIESGDTLLSVPTSLHLTPDKVRDSPIGAAVEDVVKADDESALLALGLLGELGGGEASCSCWPYIDLLPGEDAMNGMPLLWSDDDRTKLLGGSHLDGCVEGAREMLLAQWAVIEQAVLPNHPPELFPREVFNAAGYLWAHAIVLSRALPFGEALHLIPFLDLANHVAGAANTCSIGGGVTGDGPVTEAWQLDGAEGAAVLTAGAALKAGEQVFIDYGESGWRSSWEMLYTYGFVPGAAHEDWMASGGRPLFFEGVANSDPLSPQKRALLVALGADEGAADGTWLDLKPEKAQCVQMAPLLRLAHLSPEEDGLDDSVQAQSVALKEWRADPNELWTALQKPLTPATEAKVAKQVMEAVDAALSELPTADELAPRAAPPSEMFAEDWTPEAERSRLAARVMLGERSALEVCKAVWERSIAAAAAA